MHPLLLVFYLDVQGSTKDFFLSNWHTGCHYMGGTIHVYLCQMETERDGISNFYLMPIPSMRDILHGNVIPLCVLPLQLLGGPGWDHLFGWPRVGSFVGWPGVGSQQLLFVQQ